MNPTKPIAATAVLPTKAAIISLGNENPVQLKPEAITIKPITIE